MSERIGRAIACYLDQPIPGYEPLATSSPRQLRRTLRPCDVLLVEGNRRISTAAHTARADALAAAHDLAGQR